MSNFFYASPWMNEELRLFRGSVRRFVQDAFVPNQERWREQHHPDSAAWIAAGDAAVLLTDIPDDLGGGGGTFAHAAVVTEELARVGVHFGVREQSIVAHYLRRYGTEEQQRRWLPQMARGELIGAIAMTEPGAGSDLPGIKATARRVGDEYVIDGSKTFITNGLLAGLICLAVKTDTKAAGPTGISMILVETRDLQGFHVGRPLEKIGQHGQDTCELFFDSVRVPAANLLGPAEGKGFFQMMEQLPYERLTIGVSAVATCERAVAITTKYVKERTAFGKPLIDLQNTRFKLAECKTNAHVGRVFVDSCIQRVIDGELDSVSAAMAKYWLTECQSRILDECLQLHGGYGYMTEYPIARMWTDSRVQRIGGGTNEIMRDLIGWAL
jgi:acyl-CoA dehydrogenase